MGKKKNKKKNMLERNAFIKGSTRGDRFSEERGWRELTNEWADLLLKGNGPSIGRGPRKGPGVPVSA